MNHCKKCGADNPETALYCRECGGELTGEIRLTIVIFRRTWRKVKLPLKICAYVFCLNIIILSCYIYFYLAKERAYQLRSEIIEKFEKDNKNLYDTDSNAYYEKFDQELTRIKVLADKAWSIYNFWEGVLAIMSVFFTAPITILGIVFFFKYHRRWTLFNLDKSFAGVKENIKNYTFSQNTTTECIKIKENAKGELNLKDKSLGARGYFHLIKDKDGNAVIIGEKYNTQAFIRSVFGKDVNFIEN
jgi:hypothetical protein